MSTNDSRPTFVLNRRRALAAPAAALMAGVLGPALLSACGGGGADDAAAGGGTAQSYTSGPIGGLGSIIVGGVRFDDNSARIEDDDDDSPRDRSVLKLGMVVEVSSSSIDDSTGRAVAGLIRFGSELKGPVASIDSVAQTLRMLDQTVEVRGETVFDAALVGGFAALAVNQILEIHALFDSATGRYLATRIELEDSADNYRLRGRVSALDSANKVFQIGDAVINYSSVPAGELPNNFAEGQRVRVRLQTEQVNGQWVAISVRTGVRRVDDINDARIRGFVNGFVSAAQFQVNGIAIDAAAARIDGTVRDGALVEVRGRVVNGALVASRVKVIDRLGDEIKRFELHGAVSALDTAAQTFMLREVKIDYSRVVEWKDGSAATLTDGQAVEVKGLWAEDRSVMFAAVIEFE